MPPTIDCRGLACPGPVLQCKQCVDNDAPATLTVVVDNEAAKENVTRYMGTRGYAVSVAQDGAVWNVVGTREGAPEAPDAAPGCGCEVMSPAALAALEQKVCVFLPADVMGVGDDELGAKLMASFTATLPELGEELWRIVLVNGGVHMAVPGHLCFENLKKLEDAGVSILVCGTCLDFFGLLEKKGLGQTTNMLDVVTSLQLATKVIRV